MKKIGRYEIVGRLGRGAMSTVYKAKAPVTGRLVALKILQPRDDIFESLVGYDRLREIFIEEGRIMGEVSHDHVAKIIDCDEHEGQPFMVLEYFAHSIGAFIGEAYKVEEHSRVISLGKTKSYLEQTLRGLERLHFAGIIHRDVKPYNLMITNDDRVKIIDFGLSRVRGEEKMLITGMQVGSPYYAAPEQEQDPEGADHRADLYSLGVLGYRMLTGRLYSRSDGDVSLPLSNGEVAEKWQNFLNIALAKKPLQRFANAQAMRIALEALPVAQNAPADSDQFSWVSSGVGGGCRTKPTRVMLKDIRGILGLDELFRPKTYCRPHFSVLGQELALENNNGLYWQRRGAGFTLNWQQAHDYVEQLNELRWAERDTWRLPTVEEVNSIIGPPLHSETCSSWPLFDRTLHWLWTADHCNKRQAWVVDVIESFYQRLDRDGAASVCAVSASD